MSDPVTNVAIEDVLSSIRRLVSEDNRFESRPAQSKPESNVERLILTPAQRVEGQAETSDEDHSAPLEQHDNWSEPQPEDQAATSDDQSDAVHEEPAEDYDPESPWTDPDATLHEAARLAEDFSFEPDVAEDSSGADEDDDFSYDLAEDDTEAQSDPEGDPFETAQDSSGSDEAQMAEMIDPELIEADVLAFIKAEEETEDAAQNHQSDDVEAEAYIDDPVPQEVEFVELDQDLDEDADDTPNGSCEEPVADPEETVVEEIMAEAHDAAEPFKDDLTDKIRALEDAVSRNAQANWELDDAPEQSAAQSGEEEPQPMVWRDLEEDQPLNAQPQDEFEPYLAAVAVDEDEALLDEEALREMVSEIVRQELQGVLGERITRNVRKLVRREIQRALSAQELE